MGIVLRTIAATSLMAFAHAPLSAQTAEPQVPVQPAPPTLDPRACADRDRPAQSDAHETEGRAAGEEESLGDRLARTDGVICPPPGLDPSIRAPAPNGGATPVIPPPGSPGGDPSLRPK